MSNLDTIIFSQPYRITDKIKNGKEASSPLIKGKIVGIRKGRQVDPHNTTVLEIQVYEDRLRGAQAAQETNDKIQRSLEMKFRK